MEAWKHYIQKVKPYVPGEQPNQKNMIKLNTNENPYPPAEEVLEAMCSVSEDNLRRYPDPEAQVLVDALAQYHQRKPEEIFVGVGSDDVLAMAFLTFFHSEKPILFPDITYSFYKVWANLFQIPYECPKLDEDFRIRKEDYEKENGGIVIANPNAPTSIYENLDFIREILEKNQDSVVIIDEAYIDFGGKSAKELIPEYENLLVVQTFSKSRSLAGLRIGYALGSETLIGAMKNVKFSYNSYTLSPFAFQMGAASLKNHVYFGQIMEKVINTRERVKKALKEFGFSFFDSKTNFIFAKHESLNAAELYQALRDRQIFVRYFNESRIDQYLRITIGTEEEMDQFLDFVKKYIRKDRN